MPKGSLAGKYIFSVESSSLIHHNSLIRNLFVFNVDSLMGYDTFMQTQSFELQSTLVISKSKGSSRYPYFDISDL